MTTPTTADMMQEKVKRYRPKDCDVRGCGCGTREDENGFYVAHRDYHQLKQQNAALRERVMELEKAAVCLIAYCGVGATGIEQDHPAWVAGLRKYADKLKAALAMGEGSKEAHGKD